MLSTDQIHRFVEIYDLADDYLKADRKKPMTETDARLYLIKHSTVFRTRRPTPTETFIFFMLVNRAFRVARRRLDALDTANQPVEAQA